MKHSFIAGKPAISIYENIVFGTFEKVLISKKTKKVMGLVGSQKFGDSPFFIPMGKIYALGDNAIIIRNIAEINSDIPENGKYVHRGASVIGLSGNSYGKLSDIEFDRDGSNLKFITDENFTFKLDNIVSDDKELILICPDNKIPLSKFKPRIKSFITSEAKDIIVRALNTETPQIGITAESTGQQRKISFNYTTAIPKRFTMKTDSSLVGKKAVTNILGYNNEVIARAGQTITERQIEIAKKHNKLRELIMMTE